MPAEGQGEIRLIAMHNLEQIFGERRIAVLVQRHAQLAAHSGEPVILESGGESRMTSVASCTARSADRHR